jgi:hypothetical protein
MAASLSGTGIFLRASWYPYHITAVYETRHLSDQPQLTLPPIFTARAERERGVSREQKTHTTATIVIRLKSMKKAFIALGRSRILRPSEMIAMLATVIDSGPNCSLPDQLYLYDLPLTPLT